MPDTPALSITREQVASLNPQAQATLDAQLTKSFSAEQRTAIGLAPPNTPAAPPEKMTLKEANLELHQNLPRLQEAGTSPSDYDIWLPTSVVANMTVPEANQLRGFVQVAFNTAGIPKSQGQMLTNAMMESAKEWGQMSPSQQQDFLKGEMQAIANLRNSSVKDKWALAWERLPADFKAYAEKNGFFASRSARLALANCADLMLRRDTK